MEPCKEAERLMGARETRLEALNYHRWYADSSHSDKTERTTTMRDGGAVAEMERGTAPESWSSLQPIRHWMHEGLVLGDRWNTAGWNIGGACPLRKRGSEMNLRDTNEGLTHTF